ncbi:hypothetical protein KJ652_02440 [Patescibacteria group bacterium]|nr:hypothetical protein [Patescibacteria group bacterium]MBU1123425.1 hypothetical protein [Patescibacteria group bacterium]MBU1911792.1 hypothetical protein [Patescibacteria group bacterium]
MSTDKPTTPAAEETKVCERMKEVVAERTGRTISDLRIEFKEGVFVLMGRAPTYFIKDLVSTVIAEEFDGVSYSNVIEVNPNI